MFVDSVELAISSGRGGAGCSSFRKEKFVVNGGPDGGDGGRGGNVVFRVDNNTDTLSWYKGRTHLKADNGKPGMGRKMTGKSAEPLVLVVPPGTQVINVESGEVLLDLIKEGDEKLFLKGGKGGLGNVHFKSSRNQRPTHCQPGLPGVTKNVKLELKLIADVGLVGYPNVGKSTLISATSNAKPQIANYEFTTLTPKLGIVEVGEYNSFTMADIPGIIDGASEGRGLGLEFLRHIERTKVLLYTIDLTNYRDAIEQYKVLKQEVEKFSSELSRRKYAIVLTKTDALGEEELLDKTEKFITALELEVQTSNKYKFNEGNYFIQDLTYDEFNDGLPYFILPISSAARMNIESLKFALYDLKEL